jgi:hypothetical protein
MKRLSTAALLLLALATSVNLSFPQQAKADHDGWREHGWSRGFYGNNGWHRGWYHDNADWRFRRHNYYNNYYGNPWGWGTRSNYYPYGY